MIKIDTKDKKLLFEIDFDSRKTYAELSRTLSMSKRGVEYKLENLEKRKIIQNYTPVIDLSKLGYSYFRVFIKFQNLSSKIKQEIESYISQDKKIGWAIWAYDAYDIGIGIWAKNISEFKQFINPFYFKFDKYILNRIESVGREIKFLKNRYLSEINSKDYLSITEKKEEINLDDLDKKLLREIVKSPRESIVKLAEKLKESPQSISYRLKKIRKEKILLAIRPNLNHVILDKISYKLFIDLNNISEKDTNDLEDYVSNNKKVTYIVSALGICDFDVEFMADSPQDLFKFIESIQEKFPNIIRSYKTLIFDKTIKVEFLPQDF